MHATTGGLGKTRLSRKAPARAASVRSAATVLAATVADAGATTMAPEPAPFHSAEESRSGRAQDTAPAVGRDGLRVVDLCLRMRPALAATRNLVRPTPRHTRSASPPHLLPWLPIANTRTSLCQRRETPSEQSHKSLDRSSEPSSLGRPPANREKGPLASTGSDTQPACIAGRRWDHGATCSNAEPIRNSAASSPYGATN